METSLNSKFKPLIPQENRNFSAHQPVNSNDTKIDSKAEIDQSFNTFELSQAILQALQKGINLNNINGSTNIIIAIGGHINIDRNNPFEESNKKNFKVSVLKN